MILETFKLRLDLLSDASKNARWFLAASVITSLILIGVKFNLSYSASSRFVDNLVTTNKWDTNDFKHELQKDYLGQWIEGAFISVPIIGVRLSDIDVTTIGAFALMILSFCGLASLKREHRLIAHMVQYFHNNAEFDDNGLLYDALASTQIFSVITESLPNAHEDKHAKHEDKHVQEVFGALTNLLLSWSSPSLLLIPLVALTFSIACDVLQTFRPTRALILPDPLGRYDLIHMVTLRGIIYALVAIASFTFIALLTWSANVLQRSSATLINSTDVNTPQRSSALKRLRDAIKKMYKLDTIL